MEFRFRQPLRSQLPPWLARYLGGHARHPLFPLFVAGLAFACTVTFSFPFSLILISATLLAPRRWLALSLCSGLASGLGAMVLLEVFHHLGWQQIALRWPELVQAEALARVSRWVAEWGIWALGAIAASPLPQTPALVLCALADQPPLGVLAVVTVAKAGKYAVIAWLSQRLLGRPGP